MRRDISSTFSSDCSWNLMLSRGILWRVPKYLLWRNASMRPSLYLALALGATVLTANPASAQVTYGKKPELPAPFATQTVGNGPDHSKPPAGFLPTVPAGFHVKIFAEGFQVPRFLAVAPDGDIFLADTGAG